MGYGAVTVSDEVSYFDKKSSPLDPSHILDILAHDINNMVYGSLGYMELVEAIGNLDRDQLKYLEKARREAKAISHMIRMVNVIVEVRSGPFVPEPMDLTKVISTSSEEAKYHVEGKNMDIISDLGPERPIIMADRHLIDLLTELFLNSMKFSEGTRTQVRVIFNKKEKGAELVIEDDGKGVPLPVKERALTRFQRLVSEGDHQGSGLGLSMVQEIVRHYGARLSLEEVDEDRRTTGLRVRIGFQDQV